MPEGPEIRRAAAALAKVLVERPLVTIEYRVPGLARRARQLQGARVVRVHARGKALLIEFDCGLVHYSHNQLYGEWRVYRSARGTDDTRSVRVVLATERHRAVLYSATDVALLDAAGVARQPYLARLGPDVFDAMLTPASIAARLAGARFASRSLGALLLDQSFIAGLGNYLRSDILYVAGLRPQCRPRDLDAAAVTRVAQAIHRLPRQSYRTAGVTNDLPRARRLRNAGVPFEDYRFLVYSRDGSPCWTCGRRIRRHETGGRGLFYCPGCQIL